MSSYPSWFPHWSAGTRNRLYPLYSLLLLAPIVANAHETHARGNGFMIGISHPVLGLDHLLAMIAVGVVSAMMGGTAIWMIPLIFVTNMLIGSILGGYAIPLPGIEYGIVFSVIALGAVLAIDKQVPKTIIMLLVGYFGVMHGYARGSEMPEMTNLLFYGAGFVMGTVGLHLSGVLIGVGANKVPRGGEILRVTGGAAGCVGLFLLANMLSA